MIDVPRGPLPGDTGVPGDRLYAMAHAWALDTAADVEITVVGARGEPLARVVARVAEPGPLIAMKLQSVLDRPTAKEGTDLVDIVRIVLDPEVGGIALGQLERCDDAIACDCAALARQWFGSGVARSLRRVKEAGIDDIGREELDLVLELLESATKRASQRLRKASSVACLKSFDGAWLWRGSHLRSWSTRRVRTDRSSRR